MDSDVVKSIHARSGQECIFQCVLQDESCRSVNFGKTSTCEENCEFLSAVASENPEQLHKNEQFDYYILLQPILDQAIVATQTWTYEIRETEGGWEGGWRSISWANFQCIS